MNEVLYLESDEEITTAIDKLVKLKAAKVMVAVPKRSTLLASIVNLKLLKKAAEDAGKELVLVTTDRTATHLAGQLGLAVAATVKSEASVPKVEATKPTGASEDIVESEVDETPPAAAESGTGESPIEPNDPVTPSGSPRPDFARPVLVKNPPATSKVKIPHVKIPDFSALQKRIGLVAACVAVLVLAVLANFFLKTATLTIFAKGTEVRANFAFTIDPSIKDSDSGRALLAGQKLEVAKDLTQTFSATGSKDIGTKSHGTLTIKNCEDTSPHNLAAGVTMTSGGKNFVTDAAVAIPAGSFSGGGTVCTSTTANVNITASENGDSYNLGPANYTSTSLSSNFRITGNQMSGGTSKKITIVTQADVDKARTDLVTQSLDGAQKDLAGKAPAGFQAFAETFEHTESAITSSPAVGEEAGQATLSLHAVYSELAVSKSSYTSMVKAQEQKLVGDANQIYDDGSDDAKLTADKRDASGRQTLHFDGSAYAGAKLDSAKIAKDVAGKRYGDAADVASKLPGVDHVEISIWPSIATKLPRIPSHIKIDIKVAGRAG